MTRAPLSQPLTPTQQLVAELVAGGKTAPQVAERMGVKVVTVRFHIRTAAAKMPGTLPAMSRIAAWWRGATMHVLNGGER